MSGSPVAVFARLTVFMPNVEVNGITVEHDVRGEGPTILLVMGLSGQLIDWPEEFVDRFVARGYRVVRFDNRDSGLSTMTTWEPPSRLRQFISFLLRRPVKQVDYTMKDMADDAAGLLGTLGIDSAHVVGASMGGMIAQEMAIGHPQVVLSMCSIMSNTGDRKNGGISSSLVPKFARIGRPTRENAVESVVQIMAAISGPHFDAEVYRPLAERGVERSWAPEGVARQSAAIAGSRDRTPYLAAVTAPTLVIHGLADPLVKPSGGIATAQAIPGSRLLAFADMAHDLPRPRWGEIADAIIANAERADGGGNG